MTTKNKQEIYKRLEKMIRGSVKGPLVLREGYVYVTKKGKATKPQVHIYGKKEVSILNLPKRQTYVAGIILQKHFVGFYSMPGYSHPKLLKTLPPELRSSLKGKSCFHITKLTPDIEKGLQKHIKEGIALYKKEGWI